MAKFRTGWLDRLGIQWTGSDLDDRHHTFAGRHPGTVLSYRLGNEHESKTALLKLFRRVLKETASVPGVIGFGSDSRWPECWTSVSQSAWALPDDCH